MQEQDNVRRQTPAEPEDGASAAPDRTQKNRAPAAYDENHPRKIDTAFDFIELFVVTLVTVLLLFCFVFRHSVVDGPSMNATLTDGDHLIISNLFYSPERGDVIVFEDYSLGRSERKPLVKRVIAVAGDVVEIRGNAVYLNGEKLDEPYVCIDDENYRYVSMAALTVPEGKIFVLGDHRNNSKGQKSMP